ncbi:DNA replication and repair protein RecF [bacterium HR18]|nr:DNA replication and repair protein RecF [bacterium HR18]
MLTRLTVKNFRCLENVEVPLGPLIAFVGPNGVGKTTFLRAIELVLGDTWPSLRSFRIPQDFTNFDTSRDLEICVSFDPPYVHRDTLSNEYTITCLRLTCKPYKRTGKWGEAGDLHVDFEPLDEKGEVPSVSVKPPTTGQKAQFRPLTVTTGLREHARVLFIDHRRSLAQHLPNTRGSILGRLLQPARKEFKAQADFKKAYEQAMDLLRTEQVKRIEQMVADTAKRMLGFLGRDVARSVDISFGFADPANPFNSLRLQYCESGLTVPGEELGLGVQSAIVVGIFDAFRQLGEKFGTVIIEEPEMYLHPQAQRYFYRLLCEMADNNQCQVIYSTHSPIFADVNRFEALRLVRKDKVDRVVVSYVRQEDKNALDNVKNRFKLGGRFDTARNEVLFARRALLVEGYGDRVAALLLFEKLGIDPDAECIAVVDCGGKAGIELIVGVCKALDIPFVVVHDEDVWPIDEQADDETRRKQEQEKKAEEEKNQRIQECAGVERIFVVKPSLEAALGISRNATDKPYRIAEALKAVDVKELSDALQPFVEAIQRVATAMEESSIAREPEIRPEASS